MPGPPACGRVAVTVERLLELQRPVEEVTADSARARERDLRGGRKREREGRRVGQLLGERQARCRVPSALPVVASLLSQPHQLTKDVHLLAGLETRLGKGTAQQLHGHRKAFRHPARTGEPAEGLGPDSAGLRSGDCFLEQDCRLPGVTGIPAVLGGADPASVDALERIRRRQRDRALGQVGRSLSRPARMRVPGRGVQRGRDLLVGPGCRDR